MKGVLGEGDAELVMEHKDAIINDEEKLQSMIRGVLETAKNRGQSTGLEEMPHYIRESASLTEWAGETPLMPVVSGPGARGAGVTMTTTAMATPHSTRSHVSMGRNGLTVITDEELMVVEDSLAEDVRREAEAKRLKEEAQKKVREILEFRQNVVFALVAINLTWVALFLSLSFHESLQLFEANSLGIILFFVTGLIIVFQFAALVANRWSEMLLWVFNQWR